MVLLTPALFDCAPTTAKGLVRPALRGAGFGARPSFAPQGRPAAAPRAERSARVAA